MSAEVTTRIRWHAGLIAQGEDRVPSVAQATLDTRGSSGRLAVAVDDFVGVLSRLNHELNGPVPSETPGSSEDIPRDVAYAVAEVARLLRDCEPTIVNASDAVWSIETAWRAVLAGDIDNIHGHLDEERAAPK